MGAGKTRYYVLRHARGVVRKYLLKIGDEGVFRKNLDRMFQVPPPDGRDFYLQRELVSEAVIHGIEHYRVKKLAVLGAFIAGKAMLPANRKRCALIVRHVRRRVRHFLVHTDDPNIKPIVDKVEAILDKIKKIVQDVQDQATKVVEQLKAYHELVKQETAKQIEKIEALQEKLEQAAGEAAEKIKAELEKQLEILKKVKEAVAQSAEKIEAILKACGNDVEAAAKKIAAETKALAKKIWDIVTGQGDQPER